jgi:hypothetical protein
MSENIIGFSFIIKLVDSDGKDFQIDRVVVKGTDKEAAEAEAKMRMHGLARKWPDTMVVTHWEPIYANK